LPAQSFSTIFYCTRFETSLSPDHNISVTTSLDFYRITEACIPEEEAEEYYVVGYKVITAVTILFLRNVDGFLPGCTALYPRK
jgi:hypothetical protein